MNPQHMHLKVQHYVPTLAVIAQIYKSHCTCLQQV